MEDIHILGQKTRTSQDLYSPLWSTVLWRLFQNLKMLITDMTGVTTEVQIKPDEGNAQLHVYGNVPTYLSRYYHDHFPTQEYIIP